MSVFQVSLNSFGSTPVSNVFFTPLAGTNGDGAALTPRTIYAPGPNKINRVLKDGDIFTDCNYWKRFAYPALPLDQAWISVVTDDGSTYDDFEPNGGVQTVGTSITAAAGSSYATSGNQFTILATYGNPASFVQLTNTSGSIPVQVRLNGVTTAVFTLAAATTQMFNMGDLQIGLIEIANAGGSSAIIQIIAGVQVVPLS
jgi:hypothetical protein